MGWMGPRHMKDEIERLIGANAYCRDGSDIEGADFAAEAILSFLRAQGIEARQGGNGEAGAIEDESPAGVAGVPD